jgi:hypothetical protein
VLLEDVQTIMIDVQADSSYHSKLESIMGFIITIIECPQFHVGAADQALRLLNYSSLDTEAYYVGSPRTPA